MNRTKSSVLRRVVATLAMIPVLLAATGCGGGGFDKGSGGNSVTIVGQKFTEAEVMTQLYKQLLEKAGYSTSVKNFTTRDIYLKALQDNSVQVSADYLSSMTDALNKKTNGPDAASVASPDEQATLAKLKELGKKYDVAPLEPAKAEDANAYAVTKQFAEQNNLKTLSDLGKLGKPVALAANSDCQDRSDCAKGLDSVYGIKVSKVEPLGFDSPDTKNALKKDEVQLGQVATTDGTLDNDGLVILEDDKNWQNAENLVPVVNSKWLAKNQKAADALNKLSKVLTTDELAKLIVKVDVERAEAKTVAEDFLKQQNLI